MTNPRPFVSPDAGAATAGGAGAEAEGDRRRGQRLRSMLGVKIMYGAGMANADAILRNLSPTGARLQIGPEVVLPERFAVVRLREMTVTNARLAWRRHDSIGVEWIGEPIWLYESNHPEHKNLLRSLIT